MSIFLVRHGDYDPNTGNLTPEGMVQSVQAAERLVKQGLGSLALILSSSAPRAEQTAHILLDELNTRIIFSDELNTVGNRPQNLDSLDDLLKQELDKNDTALAPGQDLVVVTHAPMINQVIDPHNQGGLRAQNGGVYQYEPGSWDSRKAA